MRIIGRRSAPNQTLTPLSKIEGALQELDETAYWLELLADAGIYEKENLADLMKEADELIAILVTVTKTASPKKTK